MLCTNLSHKMKILYRYNIFFSPFLIIIYNGGIAVKCYPVGGMVALFSKVFQSTTADHDKSSIA